MPIDPRLIEKYTGETGDPYDKMGRALAGMDARKASREEQRHNAKMASRVPVYTGFGGALLRLLFVHPVIGMGVIVVLIGLAIASAALL